MSVKFETTLKQTLDDGEDVEIYATSDEKGPLVHIGLNTSGNADFTLDEVSGFIDAIQAIVKEIEQA